MRGLNYFLTENYSKAISDYDMALKIDPTYAQLYVNKAQAYFYLGDETKMNEMIQLAIANGVDVEGMFDLESTDDSNLATDTTTYTSVEFSGIEVFRDVPSFEEKKTVGNLTIGKTESNSEIDSVYSGLTIEEVDEETLDSKFGSMRSELENDYTLTGIGFEANLDGEDVDYVDGEIFVKMKLPDKFVEFANRGNVGMIFYDENDSFFEQGIYDEENQTVIFPATHFSWREWVFGKPKTTLEDVIQKEAWSQATAVGSKIEEKLVENLTDNLEKLGLDGQAKTKILMAIQNNKERIAELAAAAGGDKTQDAAKSVSLFVGKVIVDSFDEEELAETFGGTTLKYLVDKPDLIKDVAKNAGEGNYWKIVELVGKDIANESLIKKSVDVGAAAWKMGITTWENKKME